MSVSAAPVFLLGFQRSGTTLLRLLLDAHPGLAIPFESMVLVDFWHKLDSYGGLSRLDARERLVRDLLAAKGISRWQPAVNLADVDLDQCGTYASTVDQVFSAYARHYGKPRWGDKTPSYLSDMHVLNAWFGDAQFVHLVRDGRDTAMSIVRQPWGPGDFLSALRQWNEVVTWSRKIGRMLPAERYIEIRYEDLVTDQEGVLRKITDFLHLPFDHTMVNAHQRSEGRMPVGSLAFHANLNRPVSGELVHRWRETLSPSDQALALRIAGPLLGELGYPVEPPAVGSARVRGRELWRAVASAARWRARRSGKLLRHALGEWAPASSRVRKEPVS